MSGFVYRQRTKKNNMLLKYYADCVSRFFDKLYSDDPMVDIFDINRKIRFCQRKCEEIKKNQRRLDRKYYKRL